MSLIIFSIQTYAKCIFITYKQCKNFLIFVQTEVSLGLKFKLVKIDMMTQFSIGSVAF